MIPVKMLVSLVTSVQIFDFGGLDIEAAVSRLVRFKFRLLFPLNFYYKFINFYVEIANFDFRIENIYNLVNLLYFQFRIPYCTRWNSVLLIKNLSTRRFNVFLLSTIIIYVKLNYYKNLNIIIN